MRLFTGAHERCEHVPEQAASRGLRPAKAAGAGSTFASAPSAGTWGAANPSSATTGTMRWPPGMP